MAKHDARFALVDADALDEVLREVSELKRMISGATITPRDEWVTVKQYADIVDRSVRTVRWWAKTGKIETKRAGGVLMVRC